MNSLDELDRSPDRIRPLRREIASDEAAADYAVFDLYGLTRDQRELVARG